MHIINCLRLVLTTNFSMWFHTVSLHLSFYSSITVYSCIIDTDVYTFCNCPSSPPSLPHTYYQVADAGFVERGFCNSIARSAHEKVGAMPTFAENHAHFLEFLREVFCPTCQSLVCLSRSLLRHAEVSHRSWFLVLYPDRGVPLSLSPVLLRTRSSPKGGSMEPQEPP